MAKKQQPGGLILSCLLLWIGAGITLISAISATLLGTTLAQSIGGFGFGIAELTAAHIAALSAFTWFIAILAIVLGIFLWMRNTYAWWIAFVFAIISVLGALSGLFLAAIGIMTFVGIAIAIVTLFALLQTDTMKVCKVKLGSWKGIDY